MQFAAHIENGKLAIENPEKYKRYLSGLNEGTNMVVDIEKKKNVRTMSQHRYYHAYLDIIAEETGNDHDYLHAFFKRKFLKPKEVHLFGERVLIAGSTTELGKHEFGDYLDKIAAYTEIPLPDPELLGAEPKTYLRLDGQKPNIPYPTEELKEALW